MIQPGIYENIILSVAMVSAKKHLSVLFRDENGNDQWVTFFKVKNTFFGKEETPEKIMRNLRGTMNQLEHILNAHGIEEKWETMTRNTPVDKYNIQDHISSPLVLQQINLNIFETFVEKIKPVRDQIPLKVAFIKRSKNKNDPFFRKFYMDQTPFMATMGTVKADLVGYTEFEKKAELVPNSPQPTDNEDFLDHIR